MAPDHNTPDQPDQNDARRGRGFAVVAAAFLGTCAGVIAFMFGVDHVPLRATTITAPTSPVPRQPSPVEAVLHERWNEARDEIARLRGESLKRDVEMLGVSLERDQFRERATVAEQRLANCQQQLQTARTLADAARREAVRSAAPAGVDETDRIPPTAVPLVP